MDEEARSELVQKFYEDWESRVQGLTDDLAKFMDELEERLMTEILSGKFPADSEDAIQNKIFIDKVTSLENLIVDDPAFRFQPTEESLKHLKNRKQIHSLTCLILSSAERNVGGIVTQMQT